MLMIPCRLPPTLGLRWTTGPFVENISYTHNNMRGAALYNVLLWPETTVDPYELRAHVFLKSVGGYLWSYAPHFIKIRMITYEY